MRRVTVQYRYFAECFSVVHTECVSKMQSVRNIYTRYENTYQQETIFSIVVHREGFLFSRIRPPIYRPPIYV